jgi:GntR family transcriptional regulator, transcriptional repressor for pyruvate dehydrogenase complex
LSAPLPSFELSRREPTNVELTRKMLDYLLSGNFKPGERIPSERQLAEALGVGRSGVRETVKSLSLLGLIEQRQGDGTYLAKSSGDLLPRVIEWGLLLDEHSVHDLIEIRYHLEIIQAGLAAERRTEAQLERLRTLIREMEQAGDDYQRYIDADIAFHLGIAEASGNAGLANILVSVQALLRVWASRVIFAAQETKTSLAMHVPILEAIERQDAQAARATMEAHMERAARRLRDTVDAPGAPAE